MCDERERLIGYVYDEVDAEERQQVRRHLEGCEVCREEVGGLRRVREDLLAWDVPEHESVWKPFAPARVTPWWREVPAWAMAAAASLTLMVGAAGGAATHALMASPDRVAEAAPVQTAATPVSLTEAQVSELEQRLFQQMRTRLATELAAMPAPASTPATLPANLVTRPALQATHQDLQDFKGFVNQAMIRLLHDLDTTNGRVEKVEADMRRANGTQGPGQH